MSRALVVAAVSSALATGCSATSHDPVFTSVELVADEQPCAAGRLCLELRGQVDGRQVGRGSCELFGPGDPDGLVALTTSPELVLRPGEVTSWLTDVSDEYFLAQLNAVCVPMAEG